MGNGSSAVEKKVGTRESGVERYGVREVLGGREVSEVQLASGGTSVADVVQY